MSRRSGSVLREMLLAPLRTVSLLAALAAFAAVLYSERALAAFLCPECFGLSRTAPGLWVDEPAVTRRALTAAANARRRVEAALGPLDTRTLFLICSRQACEAKLSGAGDGPRARAVTYGWSFVRVAPSGLDESVLTHELVHVAVHRRLGLAALALGRVPAWWNEGLATVVAEGRPGVCPRDPGPLPQGAAEWRREAGRDAGDLYRRAACRTAAWLDDNGGLAAVPATLDAVRAGARLFP